MRRVLKVLLICFVVLLCILGVSAYLISRENVQIYLAQKAVTYLEDKLKTKVSVKGVKVDFFNRVHLQELYIEDLSKDTLAYIGDFSVSTSSLLKDYWVKKEPTINNIKLSGGVVRLNRKADQPVWNYAFIEEAFASDAPKDTSDAEMPEFNLKNIEVENIHFSMLDLWGGQDIRTDIGSITLGMRKIDLPNKIVDIEEIDFSNTSVVYEEYIGGKPVGPKKPADQSKWGTAFNTEHFKIDIDKIALDKIDFEYRNKHHVSKPGVFDEQHIVANNLTTQIENIAVVEDEIKATIKSLSVKERCGLEIRELRANVKLDQHETELDKLYLKTAYSTVQDYYRMSYVNFHDFEDFINKVTMYGRFENAKVDKRDIAYFAGEEIKQLPQLCVLNGKVEGRVNELFSDDISIDGGQTYFLGSAKISGLPDIKQTIFNINAKNLQTSGSEIVRFAPEANVESIRWKELKNINFKGKFIGSTEKFLAQGLLATNHGNAEIDMTMDLGQKIPTYSAKVKTDKLNLAQIIDQKEIGILSMKGEIQGRGFDIKNIHTNMNAQVSEVTLQGERYSDIEVNGLFANQTFDGKAQSRDPNLGFNFAGKIDLNKEKPNFDFQTDIIHLNLRKFGITKEDAFLTANADLDFTGNDVDNFIGQLQLKELEIKHQGKLIQVPFVNLTSLQNSPKEKQLNLKSSIADVNIQGDFTLLGIGKSLQSFLHYYLPTYIDKVNATPNENFDFDMQVLEANDIIQLFEPKLHIAYGTDIKGNMNSRQQTLLIDGQLPSVSYEAYKLQNVVLKSTGDFRQLNLDINSENMLIKNDELLKDVVVHFDMASDTAFLVVKTNPTSELLGEAIFQCKANAHQNDIQVDLMPSSFIVKDDKWNLMSQYPIFITKNQKIFAKEIFLENGNQKISVDALEENGTNNILVKASNFDLEKLSSYLESTDNVLKARVDADVAINDIWGKTMITGAAKTTDVFRLNADTIGQVKVSFDYDVEKKQLSVKKGSSIEHDNAFVRTDGEMNFENKTLDLNASMNNTPLAFLNQFLVGTIDSLSGRASGKVQVKGTFDAPLILGDLDVTNTKLKVVFTGCTYQLDDIKLTLDNDKISFDPVKLYDDRTNPGVALLSGKITHKDFDKYRLNIKIKSDDLLTLNNDAGTSDLFYGNISSKVDMSVTGAINDVTMNINAEPLKGSKFYLPINSSGDAGTYDYIKFRTVGREQTEEEKIGEETYFKVKMKIAATPAVEAYIILDQNTGEEIIAKGNGNIVLDVDMGNEIKMYNSYVIQEGQYLFNFRGLLKKEFDLVEGGTITWNGDPFNAMLDVSAAYNTKLSLYPLISNEVEANIGVSDDDVQLSKQTNKTAVKIDLKGPLSSPTILFDIEQPESTDFSSLAYTKLQNIRKDQNELIYQAGMILFFNSFKPTQGNLNTGSLLSATGASTASDVIGSALSPFLNNVINKLTGKEFLTLNLDYKNYSTDVSAQGSGFNRSQVNIGLSANLFKDKVKVDFGNSFDFGNNAAASSNSNLVYGGDFRAQYMITDDGRWRANAFRLSNYDYARSSEPISKGGVGLIYKKVFNTWNDLFMGRRRLALSKKETAQDGNKKVGIIPTP